MANGGVITRAAVDDVKTTLAIQEVVPCLAVQLVGRPHAETTLLSLAAQIESERPWAQLRPAEFS